MEIFFLGIIASYDITVWGGFLHKSFMYATQSQFNNALLIERQKHHDISFGRMLLKLHFTVIRESCSVFFSSDFLSFLLFPRNSGYFFLTSFNVSWKKKQKTKPKMFSSWRKTSAMKFFVEWTQWEWSSYFFTRGLSLLSLIQL